MSESATTSEDPGARACWKDCTAITALAMVTQGKPLLFFSAAQLFDFLQQASLLMAPRPEV